MTTAPASDRNTFPSSSWSTSASGTSATNDAAIRAMPAGNATNRPR